MQLYKSVNSEKKSQVAQFVGPCNHKYSQVGKCFTKLMIKFYQVRVPGYIIAEKICYEIAEDSLQFEAQSLSRRPKIKLAKFDIKQYYAHMDNFRYSH